MNSIECKKRIILSVDENMNAGGALFPVDLLRKGTILIVDYHDGIYSLSHGSVTHVFPSSSLHDIPVYDKDIVIFFDPDSGPVVPDNKIRQFVSDVDKTNVITVGSATMIDAFRVYIKNSTKYDNIYVYIKEVDGTYFGFSEYTIDSNGRFIDTLPPMINDVLLYELMKD
jgi:hypothetical protein